MIRRMAFVVVATLALVAGCATHWDVDSFEAPEGNVAAKRTFYWKGGEFSTPGNKPNPELIASATTAVHHAVTTELTRKGFVEAGAATGADMHVSFQVAGSQRFVLSDERRIGAPSATTVLSPSAIQPPPASAVPREMRVRDGSVIVFIEDGASGRLIWRGMVTAETRSGSTEQAVRLIAQMAHEIAFSVPAHAAAPK